MFFLNKVQNIKKAILSTLKDQDVEPLSFDQPFYGTPLTEFMPVTDAEVMRLLSSMSSKTSPLDFIPTSLIKSCSCAFEPITARLANLSFQHATFPAKFKVAQVTPLLKKHGLDDNDPASFFPISNLNTISKILERLVLTRIVPVVSTSSNFDAHQSAYKIHHSTETALLKITDDNFERFSDRQSTVLVALDQSAAFDCVDHEILLRRLNHSFGVTVKALVWIQSYLDERSTFVRWKKVSSKCSPL